MLINSVFWWFRLHSLCTAAFLSAGLLLSHSEALAQTKPKSGLQIQTLPPDTTHTVRITLDGPPYKCPPAPIYVDGQRISTDVLSKFNPDDIARIVILKKEYSQYITPDAVGVGMLIITTKQQQAQPAVRAFDEVVQRLESKQKSAANYVILDTSSGPPLPGKPKRAKGKIRYYLNEHPVTKEAVEQLDFTTLVSVEVLQGESAANYAHKKTAGVLLLQTAR